MRVYRWPPGLAVVGAEWTVDDPVNRSVSALTGRKYLSAAQRRRRVAVLDVDGAYEMGGGYIEAMKRLLRGGIHAVRLHSHAINLGDQLGREVPTGAEPLEWLTPGISGEHLGWSYGGEPMVWFTGAYYSPNPFPLTLLSPNNGMGRADVSGLPPSTDIARVGQFATVFNEAGTAYEARMLLRPVRSNGAGEASIWTDEPFTAAGNVEFDYRDTGIFLPDELPRVVRPAWSNFRATWSFREVFADEIDPDTFVEVDPWG